MTTQDEVPEFQRYQIAFSAHLRDPQQNPYPAQVPAERIAVYEEIVFNNLFESVSACFPVTQQVLGMSNWKQLVRGFMQQHSANSPIFRDIPKELLGYLEQCSYSKETPAFLYSLCHYEWVELAVASAQTSINLEDINSDGDLLAEPLVFEQAMQILYYDYPVHKISKAYQPTETAETHLLVYRDTEDEVKFIELNAMTHQLITLLLQPMTGKEVLKQIAEALGYPQLDSLMTFGLGILEDLKSRGIILGTLVQKTEI
ncbi:MAG: DUF2063 domain-containing protein [Methylotenera sp.]|nr:MAG: DUF2063 domain-containing protein [Methylotenera sp.]